MTTKSLISSAVVAAFLAGGAYWLARVNNTLFSTQHTRKECSDKKCEIQVSFKWYNWDLVVDADVLEIKKGSKDVEIVWQLPKNKPYRFNTADGVTLKYPGAPPAGDDDGQITERYATDDNGTQVAQGVNYHWRSANAAGKSYLYNINVVDTTTNKPYPLDPTIRNQGQ